MRGDVPVKVGGKTHKLRLTLGAVEDIPADPLVTPPLPFLPASVLNLLAQSTYSMRDVRVVVEAGIQGAGASVTYEEIFDALGIKGTGKVALDLMLAFYGIDASGKAVAAPETVETEAIAS